MEPHIQRAKAELSALREKIALLDEFLDSDSVEIVSKQIVKQLVEQMRGMRIYERALSARIELEIIGPSAPASSH